MAWYWIVLLTIICVHLINIIIVAICEKLNIRESDYICFLCFTIYIPLYILAYPLRAISEYNHLSGYYKKHGINKVSYLFGKRVKNND